MASDYVAHADMKRAIEIAALVRDVKRRPPRSRLGVALALSAYCADLVRDDVEASQRLRQRLLEIAADLHEPLDVVPGSR